MEAFGWGSIGIALGFGLLSAITQLVYSDEEIAADFAAAGFITATIGVFVIFWL